MSSLRGWATATEQIALLFVVLFGLLLAGTAVAVLASLRRDDAEGSERHQRMKRDLRAVWIGALVFWIAWMSGPLGATVVFAVFSFLALREFITLAHTRRTDQRSLLLAFFAVLPLQYLIAGTRHFDLVTVFIPVYVFLANPEVSAVAGGPERFLERNA